MNKYLGIIIVVLLLVGTFFLVTKNPQLQTKESDKLQVSASFYPLYFFTSEIGGDEANVVNVTPSGVEPHDYDPTPQDIARMQENRLLVVNGAGFEPWLEKIKGELSNVTIVDTTDGIYLQDALAGNEYEEEDTSSVGDKHETVVNDPHVWLSPVKAKEQVDRIAEGFVTVDPDNKAYYEENARKLKERLDGLDNKFKEGLSACQQQSFVTSHAAFAYLAEAYQLKQVAISGISPEEEPSAAELAEVTKFAKANNIKYIFFETLVSPKLSETIATEVGAKTLVLDPIEGISDDDRKQGKNYFTVMEDNLINLQEALECSK